MLVFRSSKTTGIASADGDKAFDADEFIAPPTAPSNASLNMTATSIKGGSLAGISVVTA